MEIVGMGFHPMESFPVRCWLVSGASGSLLQQELGWVCSPRTKGCSCLGLAESWAQTELRGAKSFN